MVLGGALGPGFVAGAPRHFAWQAWHNLTSTFVSRGRRGTISHLPSFRVAGVALMVLGGALGPGFVAWAPRHFAWQAWHNLTSTFVSRGRRGTISHLPSFCVAGVALMVLGGALGPGFVAWAPRHFAWQAWHNLTSTLISRGRRGTNSQLPSFCMAGVPLMVLGGALGPGFVAGAPRHFAWQAWHNLTSTFVSRGRRGTISHLPSLRGRRGTHGFSGLFTHVMCRHVLWSLRHVVFSDLFSSSPRLFYWPVCACYVPACLMVAPACFIFRYVSCFFRHVLCVVAPACLLHVYLPACFFFPRVSACLILACFLPHTHTCGQGLVLLVVATTGGAQTDSVSCMQAFIMSFLWFLVQLEVADNSSSRDNAMYEAENDQLIGKLIEPERATSALRLVQTLVVLLERLILLLEEIRAISRNSLAVIAMLKDNLLNVEAELQQRSCEVREQILARYHRALRGWREQ